MLSFWRTSFRGGFLSVALEEEEEMDFSNLGFGSDDEAFFDSSTSTDWWCHLSTLSLVGCPKSILGPPFPKLFAWAGLALAGFNWPIELDSFSKRVINLSIFSLADLRPEKVKRCFYVETTNQVDFTEFLRKLQFYTNLLQIKVLTDLVWLRGQNEV